MISLIQWFISSSVLILVVLLLRQLLWKKLSLFIRYTLWGAVLIRLLLPFALFSTSFNLSSVIQPIQSQAENKMFYAVPTRTYESKIKYDEPYYSRTEHTHTFRFSGKSYEYLNYLSGGSVNYQGQRTDYFVLMPTDELLILVWKIGALLLSLRLLYMNYSFRIHLKEKRKPYAVQNSPIPIYLISEELPSPCLAGLFRPAVYLTPDCIQDETTLNHVLAHELTHFAHKDHVWSAMRCLCLILHWYNPLVWVAAVLSRRDGELACDAGAVKRLGESEPLQISCSPDIFFSMNTIPEPSVR